MVARIALPIALLGVGYAVLVADRWRIDHELQLVAPVQARPGDTIPLRAFAFADVDDEDGGRLETASVEVVLTRGDGALATTSLRPSPVQSSEGSLEIPPSMRLGDASLLATARVAGHVVATVERPLRIEPQVVGMSLGGRTSARLSLRQLGPIEFDGPVVPLIGSLEVRVRGGVCVPDEPCEVLVDAGPHLSVVFDPVPALEVRSASTEGGVHRVRVVVHGAEAATTLRVVDASTGAPVAHRTVRLPVALATPWLDVATPASPRARLRLRPPPGRSQLVVDAFQEGRWTATATMASRDEVLPFELAPGLTRLQVRADPFGGEYVASRYVQVGDPAAEGVGAALRIEGLDPPARDLPEAMLLADAEEAQLVLPDATSGLAADQARVEVARRRLHLAGGAALGIGVVIVVVLILRRGLRAAAEARAVLSAAGDPDADSRSARWHSVLEVVLLVAGVGLALIAGIALILVRGALSGG